MEPAVSLGSDVQYRAGPVVNVDELPRRLVCVIIRYEPERQRLAFVAVAGVGVGIGLADGRQRR